mmetsp:Transcript_98765/g.144556  ORF Transcript_98765/g.144556 Transcript_98765/m.144556 type:complete len:87 (+) Transcript_98765:52-312(+)
MHQSSWSSLYGHCAPVVTHGSLPWLSEPRLLTDNTGHKSGLLRGNLSVDIALAKRLLQEATLVGLLVSESSFKFAASHFRTLSSLL